tara:strand:+ start:350 stop:664 length:315 start_codon:yes stop_codon:yes gene_type:complete
VDQLVILVEQEIHLLQILFKDLLVVQVFILTVYHMLWEVVVELQQLVLMVLIVLVELETEVQEHQMQSQDQQLHTQAVVEVEPLESLQELVELAVVEILILREQ